MSQPDGRGGPLVVESHMVRLRVTAETRSVGTVWESHGVTYGPPVVFDDRTILDVSLTPEQFEAVKAALMGATK